jgi:hypothetical protein
MHKKIMFASFIFLVVIGCNSRNDKNNELKNKPESSTVSKADTNKPEELDIENFIFVGNYGGLPSLYKYDFLTKRTKVIWSSNTESVVDLSYSEDRKFAFFLTAGKYGKIGLLPYINHINLYLIRTDSLKINFISNIGSGLQVFTAWEKDNNFKIILNSVDKTISKYINQDTKIFNTYCRLLLDETKTYNLEEEGYPEPIKPKQKMISPQKKFLVSFEKDSLVWVYLNDLQKKSKILIAKINQGLNRVEWSEDGLYIFISTTGSTIEKLSAAGNEEKKTQLSEQIPSADLYMFSMRQLKVLKDWGGTGLKYFYVTKYYLIFDDGWGDNSSIKIFNYRKLNLVKTIRINGGCGLRKIPRLE